MELIRSRAGYAVLSILFLLGPLSCDSSPSSPDEAGEVTRGTIVGILPFQNYVVELEMTGEEVANTLAGDLIVAGMKVEGGVFHADGSPLKMDSVYHVLTTDYLYARNDYPFHIFDPDPYQTGLRYSQPTILYLESLGTSPADPLNNYLDPLPRR